LPLTKPLPEVERFRSPSPEREKTDEGEIHLKMNMWIYGYKAIISM